MEKNPGAGARGRTQKNDKGHERGRRDFKLREVRRVAGISRGETETVGPAAAGPPDICPSSTPCARRSDRSLHAGDRRRSRATQPPGEPRRGRKVVVADVVALGLVACSRRICARRAGDRLREYRNCGRFPESGRFRAVFGRSDRGNARCAEAEAISVGDEAISARDEIVSIADEHISATGKLTSVADKFVTVPNERSSVTDEAISAGDDLTAVADEIISMSDTPRSVAAKSRSVTDEQERTVGILVSAGDSRRAIATARTCPPCRTTCSASPSRARRA